ncbi:MAG TPA: c-type cytochrome [Bryobacteraceae bacterium]|nr:c-type cytochrome [Bryobacteraceae bacterium]
MSRGKIIPVAAFVAVLTIVLSFLWFVKSHGFSARAKPSAMEAMLARHVRRIATDPGVKGRTNPLQPTPLAIAEARDHFADHCALCHANDGSGKTVIGANMYPPAPDMRDKGTQNLTDGELFSIIQNGIRFTGMPGWGGEDQENWQLVLFIRHLPQLSEKERQLMNEVNHLDPDAAVENEEKKPDRHHEQEIKP